MTEIEFRSATVTDVNWPNRTIELVVMPYEQVAQIVTSTRVFDEIVTRGAFDGVEKRASKVKLNMDHRLDLPSTIGRTVELHPSRDEGLVAEVKIFRNHALGDLLLEQAAEDSLGASAGFTLLRDDATGKAKAGAEGWETRSRRRLNHLFLDHIAATPTPAYEGARVLSVRDTPGSRQEAAGAVARPNLDRIKLEHWKAQAAELDSRYSSVR
jgi:HK97 family phage prohead protease